MSAAESVDPFGDSTNHNTGPELQEYLDTIADPSGVLVLSHIPAMVGGLKSRQFIVKSPNASPDTPPDPDTALDLRYSALPPQNFDELYTFFDAQEEVADRQYPDALFEAEQIIADARDRGIRVHTLFIPDTTGHYSAGAYDRRLRRLAQDTGINVVIRKEDYDEDIVHNEFQTFVPPRASSIHNYWLRREPNIHLDTPKRIEPEPPDHEILNIFESLASTPQEAWAGDWWSPAAKLLARQLETVASSSPQKLRSWLLDGDSPDHILPLIQHLAYGEGRVGQYQRLAARVILAKLDDPANLAATRLELRSKTGAHRNENSISVPLGIHMRQDPSRVPLVMHEVENIMGGNSENAHELTFLLGALYNSYDPRVASFMTSYLDLLSADRTRQAQTMLGSIFRLMPGYIDILQVQPPSPSQQQALSIIGERLAALATTLTPEQLRRSGIPPLNAYRDITDMLLKLQNPEHQDALRQHIIALYEQADSIITNETFEQAYIRYRKLYGDIPEIMPATISNPQWRQADLATSNSSVGEVMQTVAETIATLGRVTTASAQTAETIRQARASLQELLAGSNSKHICSLLTVLGEILYNLETAGEATHQATTGLEGYTI